MNACLLLQLASCCRISSEQQVGCSWQSMMRWAGGSNYLVAGLLLIVFSCSLNDECPSMHIHTYMWQARGLHAHTRRSTISATSALVVLHSLCAHLCGVSSSSTISAVFGSARLRAAAHTVCVHGFFVRLYMLHVPFVSHVGTDRCASSLCIHTYMHGIFLCFFLRLLVGMRSSWTRTEPGYKARGLPWGTTARRTSTALTW